MHDRADLAAHGGGDQIGHLTGSWPGVEVRVREVDVDDGRELDQPRRHVGVHVERHPDRHVRTDGGPHAPDDLGVGVGMLARDRRAVEREQHAVEGAAAIEGGEKIGDHRLEGVGRDRAHGGELVEDQRHDVDVGIVGAELEEAAERRLGVRELGGERLACDGSGGEPALERGRDRRVRVRLVQDPEGGESHGRNLHQLTG